MPPRSAAEVGECGAGAVEGPHEVHVHHALHHVGGGVFDGAVVAEARVADHDVEPAEPGDREVDEGCDVCLAGHVACTCDGGSAGRLDPVDGVRQTIGAPRAQHHVHTVPREMFRAGESDARRGACDHRRAAAKLHPGMIQSAVPMADPCVALLEQLVAIDSVNPSLVPGAAGEGEVAAFIADHLRGMGLDVHVQEAAPGRPNVVGVLDTGRPGPSLMFCGHIDTVGVHGMDRPFQPFRRDDRIYGRGTQDMKGGVAAMVDAARVLQDRAPARGRLLIAAVVDEEFESIGADALVKEWRADAAVVTEPTDLQVAVAHKGFAWFEIEAFGRAAHGSRPAEGIDAIFRTGRVLARLEALDRALQSRPAHPLMGTASLHASTISGGHEWSSYPAHCVLKLERRTVAGETAVGALREVEAILEELRSADSTFQGDARLVFSRSPHETAVDHPLTQALLERARARGVQAGTTGMSFWTDAAILSEAGIPSVLFGPGGAGLHSTEEYVREEDVIVCRDVLADLAHAWLR